MCVLRKRDAIEGDKENEAYLNKALNLVGNIEESASDPGNGRFLVLKETRLRLHRGGVEMGNLGLPSLGKAGLEGAVGIKRIRKNQCGCFRNDSCPACIVVVCDNNSRAKILEEIVDGLGVFGHSSKNLAVPDDGLQIPVPELDGRDEDPIFDHGLELKDRGQDRVLHRCRIGINQGRDGRVGGDDHLLELELLGIAGDL